MGYYYNYLEDVDRNAPLGTDDYNYMGTNLDRKKVYEQKPRIMFPRSKNYPNLAPEQVFDEAGRVLAGDRRRFSGMSRPQYKGKTTAPMSSLTQRSRGLQQQFAQKPAPYTKKIESVLNRPRTGISEQSLQDQLQGVTRGQTDFSNRNMLNSLRKQFGESYAPREERFMRKGQKDIRREAERAAGSFGDIRTASENLEGSSNAQLVKALRAQQSQKTGRRSALTGMLDKFGSQKHAHTNLVNQAARSEFDEEAAAPYKRMDMLGRTIQSLKGETELGVHPDRQDQAGLDMIQALKAYGVDTNAPTDTWTGGGKPSYPGQLVKNLSPETETSHRVLEAMSPKYRDAFYGSRKNLTKQLMENQSIGGQAMEAVPERMRGEVEALESEAKKKLKKDLSSLSQKFIQSNQYNSPQHIKAAENRAREISASTFGERNKLLQDAMKSELDTAHKGQISKFSQLGLEGEQGQKEYHDALKTIQDMNTLGSTKWDNEQTENEDLYKNYQGSTSWDWPHMQGSTAGGGGGGNISLDQLDKLNTSYSESEKEPMRNVTPITKADELKPAMNYQNTLEGLQENQKRLDKEYEERVNRWNDGGGKLKGQAYYDARKILDKSQTDAMRNQHEIKRLRYQDDPEHLEKIDKLFRDRMDNMAKHAKEGEVTGLKRDAQREVDERNQAKYKAEQQKMRDDQPGDPFAHPAVMGRQKLLGKFSKKYWTEDYARDWLKRGNIPWTRKHQEAYYASKK